MRPRIGILCNLVEEASSAHSPRDLAVHAYSAVIAAAGGAPLLLPCVDDPEAVVAVLENVQGVILSGGSDVDPRHYGQEPRPHLGALSPARDRLDAAVAGWVMQRPQLPVLGICRGIQALNVFAGGTLIQDIPTQVTDPLKHNQQAPGEYGTHALEVLPDSLLAAALGDTAPVVNTYHHQAVCDLAPGFRAVAHSADGVVEAIERVGARFCVGVQFHPELMAPSHAGIRRLFERFVAEAAQTQT